MYGLRKTPPPGSTMIRVCSVLFIVAALGGLHDYGGNLINIAQIDYESTLAYTRAYYYIGSIVKHLVELGLGIMGLVYSRTPAKAVLLIKLGAVYIVIALILMFVYTTFYREEYISLIIIAFGKILVFVLPGLYVYGAYNAMQAYREKLANERARSQNQRVSADTDGGSGT